MTALAEVVGRYAASLSPGTRVLDVGCGLRPYEPLFAGREYVGIDVEASGREAKDKVADRLFDGLHIPYDDGEFGGVLCTQVLEHCVEPDTLLSEIARVLAPGGRFLLTVPFMWGEHETPYDFRRYSSFGVTRAVEEAGLRMVSHQKLSTGVEAIRMLVQSEMVNDQPATTAAGRFGRWATGYLWAVVLRAWARLYRFERIYVDNAVEAVKP